MGKKISVDSSTLINKVYELIEAKKIFDLSYSKLEILIQPTSYVHSVIKFFGGIIKVSPSFTLYSSYCVSFREVIVLPPWFWSICHNTSISLSCMWCENSPN